jgi:hypothetical protein
LIFVVIAATAACCSGPSCFAISAICAAISRSTGTRAASAPAICCCPGLRREADLHALLDGGARPIERVELRLRLALQLLELRLRRERVDEDPHAQLALRAVDAEPRQLLVVGLRLALDVVPRRREGLPLRLADPRLRGDDGLLRRLDGARHLRLHRGDLPRALGLPEGDLVLQVGELPLALEARGADLVRCLAGRRDGRGGERGALALERVDLGERGRVDDRQPAREVLGERLLAGGERAVVRLLLRLQPVAHERELALARRLRRVEPRLERRGVGAGAEADLRRRGGRRGGRRLAARGGQAAADRRESALRLLQRGAQAQRRQRRGVGALADRAIRPGLRLLERAPCVLHVELRPELVELQLPPALLREPLQLPDRLVGRAALLAERLGVLRRELPQLLRDRLEAGLRCLQRVGRERP